VKLKAHRFSVQFLILMAAVKTISGSFVHAQPYPSDDGAVQKQPEKPSQLGPETELPFRISGGYLILVEGAIGTRTHLKFLLDTGASKSVVDSKIADDLKLHREPTQSFNFDRKLAWDQAAIPGVRFGPITAINTVMLVGSMAKYSEFARNVDAIIGLDLLQLQNFTVDYTSKKIVFRPPANRHAPLQDDVLTNGLTLQIRIQGHPVRLIVDTGFPNILLFEERLSARVPELGTTRSVSNVTLGERLHAKATNLRGVAIGPTNRDVPVLLIQAPPPEILPGIDGVMGISALKARRVHFNFTERTLSWE
jgi:predicted aspartyl protease